MGQLSLFRGRALVGRHPGDYIVADEDGVAVVRAVRRVEILQDATRFLAQTARASTLKIDVSDVRIRVLGDVAIIHAMTAFTLPDGRTGGGRYTDVWARRDGRWLAVSAHVTRMM